MLYNNELNETLITSYHELDQTTDLQLDLTSTTQRNTTTSSSFPSLSTLVTAENKESSWWGSVSSSSSSWFTSSSSASISHSPFNLSDSYLGTFTSIPSAFPYPESSPYPSSSASPSFSSSLEWVDHYPGSAGVPRSTVLQRHGLVLAGVELATPYTSWQIVVLALAAGTTSLVTIGGNLIVLLSFFLERSIRQPSNYFIASLAVSDLLIGVCSMPLYTTYILSVKTWPLGEVLTIVFLTWIIPVSVFFTSIFGWQYFTGQRTVPDRKCYVQYMEDALFNCLLQVGYFWITLTAMFVLYTGIYRVALDLHRRSEDKQKKCMSSLATMAQTTVGHLGTTAIVMARRNPNGLDPATVPVPASCLAPGVRPGPVPLILDPANLWGQGENSGAGGGGGADASPETPLDGDESNSSCASTPEMQRKAGREAGEGGEAWPGAPGDAVIGRRKSLVMIDEDMRWMMPRPKNNNSQFLQLPVLSSSLVTPSAGAARAVSGDVTEAKNNINDVTKDRNSNNGGLGVMTTIFSVLEKKKNGNKAGGGCGGGVSERGGVKVGREGERRISNNVCRLAVDERRKEFNQSPPTRRLPPPIPPSPPPVRIHHQDVEVVGEGVVVSTVEGWLDNGELVGGGEVKLDVPTISLQCPFTPSASPSPFPFPSVVSPFSFTSSPPEAFNQLFNTSRDEDFVQNMTFQPQAVAMTSSSSNISTRINDVTSKCHILTLGCDVTPASTNTSPRDIGTSPSDGTSPCIVTVTSDDQTSYCVDHQTTNNHDHLATFSSDFLSQNNHLIISNRRQANHPDSQCISKCYNITGTEVASSIQAASDLTQFSTDLDHVQIKTDSHPCNELVKVKTDNNPSNDLIHVKTDTYTCNDLIQVKTDTQSSNDYLNLTQINSITVSTDIDRLTTLGTAERWTPGPDRQNQVKTGSGGPWKLTPTTSGSGSPGARKLTTVTTASGSPARDWLDWIDQTISSRSRTPRFVDNRRRPITSPDCNTSQGLVNGSGLEARVGSEGLGLRSHARSVEITGISGNGGEGLNGGVDENLQTCVWVLADDLKQPDSEMSDVIQCDDILKSILQDRNAEGSLLTHQHGSKTLVANFGAQGQTFSAQGQQLSAQGPVLSAKGSAQVQSTKGAEESADEVVWVLAEQCQVCESSHQNKIRESSGERATRSPCDRQLSSSTRPTASQSTQGSADQEVMMIIGTVMSPGTVPKISESFTEQSKSRGTISKRPYTSGATSTTLLLPSTTGRLGRTSSLVNTPRHPISSLSPPPSKPYSITSPTPHTEQTNPIPPGESREVSPPPARTTSRLSLQPDDADPAPCSSSMTSASRRTRRAGSTHSLAPSTRSGSVRTAARFDLSPLAHSGGHQGVIGGSTGMGRTGRVDSDPPLPHGGRRSSGGRSGSNSTTDGGLGPGGGGGGVGGVGEGAQSSAATSAAIAFWNLISIKAGGWGWLGGDASSAAARKARRAQKKKENRARKALRTITIILGAFVLCWTPWHVLSLIMGFCSDAAEGSAGGAVVAPCVAPVLYDISYWLCYLNSPINPFCYAFANQQFKKTFIRILRLDWHRA